MRSRRHPIEPGPPFRPPASLEARGLDSWRVVELVREADRKRLMHFTLTQPT